LPNGHFKLRARNLGIRIRHVDSLCALTAKFKRLRNAVRILLLGQ
jgi:hypothetical protein